MSNSNNNGGLSSIITPCNTADAAPKDVIISMLDAVLEKYNISQLQFNDKLVDIFRNLRRRRREFDATRFFVLVVGPVKSGKSTLVNIFARKYVSPTAYKECTALPTIIGETDGKHLNKIIKYVPTTAFSSDEEKKKTFDYIIDVIRGVEERNVLDGRIITPNPEDLTEKNIKESITLYYDSNKREEILVASIGIEGGGFIDDEVMLIDMPGLDGSQVHQDNSLVYQNMAQRADVVFFVQSTTSALNKASIDFLKSLFGDKAGTVPVWLIHNIHDSQYFLTDDDKKKSDIREQIQTGRDRIEKDFGITKFSDQVLNLGMIHTALNEPHRIKPEQQEYLQNVLEEYKKFERELIELLKSERQQIKDDNNVNKAKDVVRESITTLELLIEELEQQIRAIEGNIATAKALKEKLNDVNFNFNGNVLVAYSKLLDERNIKSSWTTNIHKLFDSKIVTTGTIRISGHDLKIELEKLALESKEIMPTREGSLFRSQLKSLIYKDITEHLADIVKEIEDSLRELHNVKNRDFLKVDITTCPIIINDTADNFSIDLSDIKETKLGGILTIHYDRGEYNRYLDSIEKKIASQIDSKITKYTELIANDYIKIRDWYIQELRNKLAEVVCQYEKAHNRAVAELNGRIELMNNIINDIKLE